MEKVALLVFKIILLAGVTLTLACRDEVMRLAQSKFIEFSQSSPQQKLTEVSSPKITALLDSAMKQIEITKGYDPKYVVIDYPNGDVASETGVCSDVVVRAFRSVGVDLQKEVHEDMTKSFSAYPKKWDLSKPDSNIDHRRVPNLQRFFERKGKSLPITQKSVDYLPGDIVSWDLNDQGMTHIGLVSNIIDENSGQYLIIHNIGAGVKAEKVLFDWKITGHFRYF